MVSVPSPSAVRPRISLVALLAAVAFVELVLNRVIARLIHLEFLQPRSALTRVIDDFGLFAFELTSVLAVLLLGAALIRIVLYGGEFRAGARMSFPLVGAVFLALAAICVVLKLPQAMQFHLHLSFLFLALLITLATVASHAQPPIKLGAVLLMAAVAMRIGPQLAARLGVLPSDVGADRGDVGCHAGVDGRGRAVLSPAAAGRREAGVAGDVADGVRGGDHHPPRLGDGGARGGVRLRRRAADRDVGPAPVPGGAGGGRVLDDPHAVARRRQSAARLRLRAARRRRLAARAAVPARARGARPVVHRRVGGARRGAAAGAHRRLGDAQQ